MPRFIQHLLIGLLLACAACNRKTDPVVASFINDEFSTNRMVLYVSGRYECYGANENGSLTRHPYLTGSFVGGVSNYLVTLDKGLFDSQDMPSRRTYQIIKHQGVEYLFDEGGSGLRKFEETRDERELRHAWRRE